MTAKVPKYSHLSPPFLIFDTEELMLLGVLYLVAMVLGGWFWLVFIAGGPLAIMYKRKKPRGYFSHIFYRIGFKKLTNYPDPSAQVFYE